MVIGTRLAKANIGLRTKGAGGINAEPPLDLHRYASEHSVLPGAEPIAEDSDHPGRQALGPVAAAGGGGTLTFSEYVVGTSNPTFTLVDNTVFTNGIIWPDGSNPTSPVLAGSTDYQAPVSVAFANPVSSVSLDAGYFNNLQSTQVIFLDVSGHVLSSQYNGGTGILHFSYASDVGIGSILVRAVALEEAGFAIDNLAVGPSIEDILPPFFQAGSLAGEITGSFGDITGGTPITQFDQLGPGDHSDTFRFSLETNATVTWQVRLVDRPEEARTFSQSYAIGNHTISLFDDPDYQSAHAYYLSVLNVEIDPFDHQQLLEAKAREIAGDILSGTLDPISLGDELFQVINGVDDATMLLSKVSKYLGPIGQLAGGIIALENVREFPNPGRQAFIEIADLMGALKATGYGALGGAVIGAGAGAFLGGMALPGAGVGARLGAAVAPIIYTFGVSDGVREEAGQVWDNAFPPQDNVGPAPALGSPEPKLGGLGSPASQEAVALIEFDSDWYLQTYADARVAFESGASPSALNYFLTIGIGRGHLPNASSASVGASDLAADPADLARATPNEAVYSIAPGALAGDGASAAELLLHDLIEDIRTGPLPLDSALTALANRKAIDLVHNFVDLPLNRQAIEGQGWAETWSSGATLQDGAEALIGSADGLTLIAVASSGQSAEEALAAILASFAERGRLLSLDHMRVGHRRIWRDLGCGACGGQLRRRSPGRCRCQPGRADWHSGRGFYCSRHLGGIDRRQRRR